MFCEINYTIIIPHKNTPELLRRCLDSIPCREDIQIIVVDDNSMLEDIDLKTFSGLNGSCVKIFFGKEGKGAGHARNMGLKEAVGNWVLFADADDYFSDGFLQHLDKYKDSNYDLIFFRSARESTKDEEKKSIISKYDKLIMQERNIEAYIYTASVAWGKMIKLSLIKENNILFDETMVANDKMFSIKVSHCAKDIHFDDQQIYTYVPSNSFLTRLKTNEANFNRFDVYVRINSFLTSISKKKYRINLIVPLKRLMDVQNMTYFWSGIRLMKQHNISLLAELFLFLMSLPKKIKK